MGKKYLAAASVKLGGKRFKPGQEVPEELVTKEAVKRGLIEGAAPEEDNGDMAARVEALEAECKELKEENASLKLILDNPSNQVANYHVERDPENPDRVLVGVDPATTSSEPAAAAKPATTSPEPAAAAKPAAKSKPAAKAKPAAKPKADNKQG